MNVNELLDAVREAMQEVPQGTEGFTVGEIAEALGRPHEAVRNVVKALIKSGAAEPVKVRRARMDGAANTVSGYRLKK